MNVSNFCVLTGRILSLIDWEEVALIVFHGLIAFAVGIWVAGETLGSWIHRTNDILAANWVKLIVPQTSVETEQALIVVEEVSTPALPAVEVELTLPPAPLVIEDPWDGDPEVELMLPLEPLAILFPTPMLTEAQGPVALLAASQELIQQPPPAATNGRRTRGRRAHKNRARQTA